ncbi:OmpP1/FadL family transporter [Pedobacter glucosidilyticus]|uniref:OmpP1/FadL family transporter n=1 Tax=Pedobacter glucosidilyticus TaxID=1122941 RepID=UPI0026F2E152|nr:outer membrane protein transport protein [Pedobacter glucosidilyticus]
MKLKIFVLSTFIVGTISSVSAQYTSDALKFSGTESSVTARFGGLGGPHTSLGGDLSSLYGNPAGLGMFSSSEFSFTPGYVNSSNKTTYLGQNSESSLGNLNINNLGVVFHSPTYRTGDLKKGLVSINFGIGYQKNNFFRNELSFSGVTNANGLGNYFANLANNDKNPSTNQPYAPDQILDNLVFAAYEGFLMDYNTNNNSYSSNTRSGADQVVSYDRKGGQSNVDFSLGMNFSNKFYLGFGLGLASINYRSEELLNEQGFNDVDNVDYNTNFSKSFDTRGSGVNFKIGAILKPVKEIRLGLSLETPTYYSIDDDYYEELSLRDPDNNFITDNNSYPFSYRLNTPLKLNGGISFFIGNKGFISADINYQDFSTIKFKSDENALNINTNRQIASTYQESINIGLGAEYKVTNNVALRAGYRNLGSPYQDLAYKANRYTGGIGYRFGSYTLDFAVQHQQNSVLSTSFYTFNNPQVTPFADTKTNVTAVSITFGARF